MPKQTHNDLLRDILSDIAVELEDEFKRNFISYAVAVATHPVKACSPLIRGQLSL